MLTAAVDETGPAGAPLDPTAMNSGASDAPESGSGPAGEDAPADDAPADDAPADDAPGDSAPATPAPAVDAADACPALGGFTIAETGSCYMLGDNVFAWQDARSFCQAWGGDLVEIGTLAENVALGERIESSVWIGANDQDEEGIFRWTSGEPVEFTRWSEGQPNDLQGGEDCGELTPLAAVWIDVPCTGDVPRRALCELSGTVTAGATQTRSFVIATPSPAL